MDKPAPGLPEIPESGVPPYTECAPGAIGRGYVHPTPGGDMSGKVESMADAGETMDGEMAGGVLTNDK